MATAVVKVEGLAELGEALKAFGQKIATKYLAHSTRAAAKVFLEEAKQLSPVLSGALQEAETIFKRPGSSPDEVQYVVGIRRIKRKSKVKRLLKVLAAAGVNVGVQDDAFYGRYMEFGFHDKAGVFHKYPFMRPAYDNKRDEAVQVFAADLAVGVQMATQEVARS